MSDPSGYLPRHLDTALRAALRSFPAVLLDGPRGAGKTTSARRHAAAQVMLPRDLEPLRADPEGYLRSLPSPVLLDEWQLAGTDVLWTIKRLVDDDPAPGRFLLTGSVEPASFGPTYPLTGRAVRLVMRPMTHAELTGAGAHRTFLERAADGDRPAASAGRPAAFLLADLEQSGFPATRSLPDPRLFLDAYAATVSQRAGEEGRDGNRLLRALRVLATLTARTVPDQRIWEAADINKLTWKAYDDLLTRMHLSASSQAMESNRLKRLTSYPKRFLADTALALALADLRAEDLRRDPNLAGPFFESYVMQQLRPQADLLGGTLLHLRTSAGEHEIDAVVQTRREVLAAEVKLTSRPTRQDARQLDWLRDRLRERFRAGYVVHAGGDSYPLGDRVWALSVAELMS